MAIGWRRNPTSRIGKNKLLVSTLLPQDRWWLIVLLSTAVEWIYMATIYLLLRRSADQWWIDLLDGSMLHWTFIKDMHWDKHNRGLPSRRAPTFILSIMHYILFSVAVNASTRDLDSNARMNFRTGLLHLPLQYSILCWAGCVLYSVTITALALS